MAVVFHFQIVPLVCLCHIYTGGDSFSSVYVEKCVKWEYKWIIIPLGL